MPTAIADLNPYPNKPRLTFKADGTFKLTVFSDLHFGENPWEDWGPEHDRNSVSLIKKVLADEKPDYACVECTTLCYWNLQPDHNWQSYQWRLDYW